jgi:hypothetical protein
MFDCKEAIQRPKGKGRNRKELERGDHFPMVVKKGSSPDSHRCQRKPNIGSAAKERSGNG